MVQTKLNGCMQLAEKTKGLSYVTKGNIKKKKWTKKELATLQKEISKLEMRKKKMVWFV